MLWPCPMCQVAKVRLVEWIVRSSDSPAFLRHFLKFRETVE